MTENINNNPFVKLATKRVLKIISDEITSQETQNLIRQKVLMPVIQMIYGELYPYIIAMIITIIFILRFSLLTFVCLFLNFFKIR